eukprot:343286-Chlamydomonas_euryale.AAC.5
MQSTACCWPAVEHSQLFPTAPSLYRAPRTSNSAVCTWTLAALTTVTMPRLSFLMSSLGGDFASAGGSSRSCSASCRCGAWSAWAVEMCGRQKCVCGGERGSRGCGTWCLRADGQKMGLRSEDWGTGKAWVSGSRLEGRGKHEFQA